MKVRALGQLRAADGESSTVSVFAKTATWLLVGCAVLLGWVVVNEVKLERRRA